MKLKIIAGRAKTGKSTYIYDEIKAEINKKVDKNLILIVPEQMTYQSEYEIIDRLNNDGIMNVEILSFKRLTYKIFEEVGGLKIQEINNYGKIMMLKQIFEEKISELQVFRKASKQEGFLREFGELIKELKQNCVSIEFLENIVKYKINNELLKRKIADIITIYSEINNKTQDRFFDDEDKMNLFIDLIEKSSYIKNSRIWIDGFDSFYGQRLAVIKKLICYSEAVTISLNVDPVCLSNPEGIGDWEAFKTTYDTFKNVTEELKEEIEIICLRNNSCMKPEIKAVENSLFTVTDIKYEGISENINIYSAMNPYSETEKSAVKIISLVRDYGYRWKDIAVAVGDMDSYSINIQKVFTQYEIPYFLDVKRDIMDNPFTKYILSILDMFIWNFKNDNVFEYLKTGFSPINYNEVSKLENFALQYGIEGLKWFKDFKFKARNVHYYNELRHRISEDFRQARKDFDKLGNASDITLFLFSFIKKHKVQELIEKQVETFKHLGAYEKSSENAQVWNYVINIFDQIIMAGADVEITPKEYRKMLESGFKEVRISIIPPTLDKVTIGGIDKVSLIKPKALFLLGLNEGKFESKNNEKGLLLDDERETLEENGMRLINSSFYASFREKHTLYKLFTSACDKLFLSYSLGTAEGRTLQPSLYIEKIKEIFPTVKEETEFTEGDEIQLISNKMGTIDRVISQIRDFTEGRAINNIWKDVYAWYERNDSKICGIIHSAVNYNNNTEKINKEYLDKLFKQPVSISVSKLESYAECPFKFYVEAVLKPQPRRISKVEIYDLGNIYHRAVEEFTNVIINNKLDIKEMKREDVFKISQSCTDSVLSEKQQEIIALEANERNSYLKNKIKRLVDRAALTIIEQLKRGSFSPEFTEFKIEKKIMLSDGQIIRLHGRADRIDIMKKDNVSYINIIDYKSSHKDIDLSDTVQGLQLQLMIYMSAIMENGEKLMHSNPEIGGVYYFCIDDPIVDGDNLSKRTPEDEIFSKLALKGYVAENMEVISNMDNKIEEAKASDIIPVSLNKDGSTKKTSKTLAVNEYKSILNKTDEVSKKIAEEIMDGFVDIKPFRKDSSTGSAVPCRYCEYLSICKFDTAAGNKYRKIKKQSRDEVLFEIMNKGGASDNGMD